MYVPQEKAKLLVEKISLVILSAAKDPEIVRDDSSAKILWIVGSTPYDS